MKAANSISHTRTLLCASGQQSFKSWRVGWRASRGPRRDRGLGSRTSPGCTTEFMVSSCELLNLSRAKVVKSEAIREFGGSHRVWQILLVGEDKQRRVAQFVLVEHLVQLLARLVDTFAIVRVDLEGVIAIPDL